MFNRVAFGHVLIENDLQVLTKGSKYPNPNTYSPSAIICTKKHSDMD